MTKLHTCEQEETPLISFVNFVSFLFPHLWKESVKLEMGLLLCLACVGTALEAVMTHVILLLVVCIFLLN